MSLSVVRGLTVCKARRARYLVVGFELSLTRARSFQFGI